MKTPHRPSFKKGQTVTWTSQASGFKKKKTGKIVEVVLPYTWMSYAKRKRFGSRQIGGMRNHRSYVVDVNGKLYWPLIKHLKLKGSTKA